MGAKKDSSATDADDVESRSGFCRKKGSKIRKVLAPVPLRFFAAKVIAPQDITSSVWIRDSVT